MLPIESNGYSIYFNDDAYAALNGHLDANRYSGVFVLVDTNTNEHCLTTLLQQLVTDLTIEIIEIDIGELSKNITTCVEVWNVLTELGADRKSLLINLGGGVVTDLGGFVASTFKRGIDFINVPTSLLAMVDASVGGKNGVDLGNLKNQIGVINNPKMVLVDTAFLDTLPQNEMRSGLAEMLKHGLIMDKTYWEQFLDLSKIDYADFDSLIYRSVEIKNTIVLQDPTEEGIRKALNFGHTLGHAIESFLMENNDREAILHGEAVAAGMVLESHLSLQKNLLTNQEYNEIKSTIIALYGRFPFTGVEIESVIDLLKHDKKNEYGKVQFALLNSIGQITISQTADDEEIILAFTDYKS